MRPVAGGTLRGDEVGNLFTRLPPPHYARARCPVLINVEALGGDPSPPRSTPVFCAVFVSIPR